MNIGGFLHQATAILADAGIGTARLDCLVLLEDELNKNRAALLAHPETPLTPAQLKKLRTKITRRAAHEPLAYIRGRADFYGREFHITPAVLVPRPESETIIDMLKHLPARALPAGPLRIADIGTGSGCLGITAALELGGHADLYDNSAAALAVARKNARAYGVQSNFFCEDLLTATHQRRYDILLANLPYVPTEFPVNRAARHEPAAALLAGPDGLALYRRFWQQIPALARQPQFILTESLPAQHHAVALLARHAGYALHARDDFIQMFEHSAVGAIVNDAPTMSAPLPTSP